MTVDVDEAGSQGLATHYRLAQNYPNPFNPSTNFTFSSPRSGRVRIVVFDHLGREVAVVADRQFGAGTHSVPWNAGSLSSGVYFFAV